METTAGNQSDIARLRVQIEQEYHAARTALTGLASGNARHDFITARMERIGGYQETLATLIGESASMAIVCDIFESDPVSHTCTRG